MRRACPGMCCRLVTLLLLAPSALAITLDEFEALKRSAHSAPLEETKARVHAFRDAASSPPPHQDKIDHFVVLLMENHAFDNIFGCNEAVISRGGDGIIGHQIPADPSNASAGFLNVTCGKAPLVCTGGPGYDQWASKFGTGGDPSTFPYGNQSDSNAALHGASGKALDMYAPEQLPIKSALAESYGVFNKMYASVPSSSSPNHLFSQSATSCGIHDNIVYSACGGSTDYYPQMTIYDSLAVNGVDYALFMNSTCGTNTANASTPCHGIDPNSASAPYGGLVAPDVGMAGVARHADQFYSHERFYERAANGTLPSFSWLVPGSQACDHPCNDLAKGERLLKDVYEALRAGPGWGKTLFLVTYDDGGGYYDHTVSPHVGVPSDDAPCHLVDKCPGGGAKFDFRRLGIRTTALLMSPWVAAGAVFQEPVKGPSNTSQFDHTSIVATAKRLFNLTGFLTKRDAWAGAFDELLLDEARPDSEMPMHLPNAPDPATPWGPPPNLAAKAAANRSEAAGAKDEEPSAGSRRLVQVSPEGDTERPAVPQHCGQKEQTCRGPQFVSTKLKRRMVEIGALLQTEVPDPMLMTVAEAERWYADRWLEWMAFHRVA